MKLYEFECPANFVRDCEKLFSKKSYPEYIEKEMYKKFLLLFRDV